MPEFSTPTGAIYYQVFEPASGHTRLLPDVVLLHNFMSTGRTAWGPIVPALQRHARVILPDLPGHGRSMGHPADFHHLEMARQLADLIEAEGAQRGHLVGCSSGGMIAQLMVQTGLIEPASLTLVSSTYSVNPATTGILTSLAPEDFRAGPRWLEMTARLHDGHHDEGYFDQELLPAFRRLTPETAIDLSLDKLGKWQLPVCLIHGEEDEIFPFSIAQAMADALPNAELHGVPEQTHALLFRKPAVVGRHLDAFLSRQAETPSAEEARVI